MRLLKLLTLIFGLCLFSLSSGLVVSRQQPVSSAWLGISDYFNQMHLYSLHKKEMYSLGGGAYPYWSPKGDWMIYGTTTYSNFPSQLHISRHPYQSSTLITVPDFPYTQEGPRISPTGDWIAFSAWSGMEAYGMFYMSADGHEIYHLANWYGAATVWSPAGDILAFIYEGGLYSIAAGDGTPIDIPNPPPFGEIPLPTTAREIVRVPDMLVSSHQWSPDGEWLFFRLIPRLHGFGHLYRVKADGSQLEQLTDDQLGSRVTSFAISPDGHHIIFTTFDGLYGMRSDGSGLKLLIGDELTVGPMGWSPDGNWIYLREGDFEDPITKGLYRMQPDGSQLQKITDEVIYYNAVLSPDGEWIAYFDLDEMALYRIRSDGSDKERLAKMHPEVTYISWSPIIDRSWNYFVLLGMGLFFIMAGFLLSVRQQKRDMAANR
jgi:Tol biopolymer transport system component